MSTPISGSRVALDFEGRTIDARVGESVMASLVANGVLSFRTTRSGAGRGPFCGMGVCQDCRVEIDGIANRRACMATVEGPMSVRREIFDRPLPDLAGERAPPAGPIAVEHPELLVIGGGPGGLAAATAARRAGVQVLLVDERASLGGQYFKQLAVTGADIADADAQHREGAALIAEAQRAGVEIRTKTEVWGAFPPGEFAAKSGGRSMRLLPTATILANGAYERGWPVPGWTLPGVMTTGAAQTLWRSARRLPGRRVLIAGNGPLNLQLAAELVGGGAEVVATLEAAPRPSVNRIPELLAMLATSPVLVRDGLVYHARRRAGDVPMVHGCTVAAIEQSKEGGLTTRTQFVDGDAPGPSFAADIVCLGYGFEPSSELLRALGCGHEFDVGTGHRRVLRDEVGRTDRAGIYAVGDCTGIGGARAALAEGTVAGFAAATDLGHTLNQSQSRDLRRARRSIAGHRRFQRALWRLYSAPGLGAPPADPAALACRCEEVTFGSLRNALGDGIQTIGALKQRTRAGMGACQGRYCGPVIESLLAKQTGIARDELSCFAPRVPVKPIRIADLAGLIDG